MTVMYDSHGTAITVGARVIEYPRDGVGTGDGPPVEVGTVTAITEPDGDTDDEGRIVGIPPAVIVQYDDGTQERWVATWNATGPWDDHRTDYTCDDITVTPDEERENLAFDEGAECENAAAELGEPGITDDTPHIPNLEESA